MVFKIFFKCNSSLHGHGLRTSSGQVLLAVSGKAQLGGLNFNPAVSDFYAFCVGVEAFCFGQADNVGGTFSQFFSIVFDDAG